MTFLVLQELMTRKAPFYNLQDATVIMRVSDGKMPSRPDAVTTHHRLNDAWWSICCLCWKTDPAKRPPMHDIIAIAEDESSHISSETFVSQAAFAPSTIAKKEVCACFLIRRVQWVDEDVLC